MIERAYPLGASDMGHELGSVRTTVVVHHDSSGRAVAIVGAMEGSGSARLITVDLEDGSTTERTLDF